MALDVLNRRSFGETARRDAWWVQPLVVFLGLSAFIVYSTWAAFQGAHYRFGPYLSPFYSPEVFGDPATSWFGGKPGWWPGLIPFSAALLILWAPGGFRFTCYYYRGAYYKAFWADPPSCAVGEPRKSYLGRALLPADPAERPPLLPLPGPVLPGLPRSTTSGRPSGSPIPPPARPRSGIGVGTLVLAVNVGLLGGYTFGCHSLRHLVGGCKDRLSGSPARHKAYDCVSCFNRRHMMWAW